MTLQPRQRPRQQLMCSRCLCLIRRLHRDDEDRQRSDVASRMPPLPSCHRRSPVRADRRGCEKKQGPLSTAPRFVFLGSIIKTPYTCGCNCARAHSAGFQGHIEAARGEVRLPQGPGSTSDDENLSVCSWVVTCTHTVAGTRDDVSFVVDDDSPDRYFLPVHAHARLGEGALHGVRRASRV